MHIGLVHPRILLPESAQSLEGLDFILRHELIHYKRKDLYVKLLSLFVNAAHWFNPLAYAMRRQLDIECELSCDEAVLQGSERKVRCSYGNTVLSVMGTSIGERTVLSTHFHSGKETLKMRLSSMLDTKKKKFSFLALTIAIILLLTVCAFSFVHVGTGSKTTSSNILNFIEFKYPDSITRVVNDNTSEIKFYVGKTLAGGARFIPYNPDDADGIQIKKDATEVGNREYSTIQDIPSIAVKLNVTGLRNKTLVENHIYLLPDTLAKGDNYKVLDFYAIEDIAPEQLDKFLAENFETVKKLPLEGKGWTNVEYDKADISKQQNTVDNNPQVDLFYQPYDESIKFIKNLYPEKYDIDIKELQSRNYGRYSAQRIFGNPHGGCNYIMHLNNVFMDKNDVVTEVNLFQPLKLGMYGVFAVSAYRELKPLNLPSIEKQNVDTNDTAVIYIGPSYSNEYIIDKFYESYKNDEPCQVDVIDGQVICRFVYDGKNLMMYTAFQTFSGDYKIYEKTELLSIEQKVYMGTYYEATTVDHKILKVTGMFNKYWPEPLANVVVDGQ